MSRILATTCAALLALAALSVQASAADGDTMRIRRARLHERSRQSGRACHALSVAGRFVVTDGMRAFDPYDDDVVVSIGGQELIRASRDDPDGRLVGRRRAVWICRTRDPDDRRARASLLLDLRRGAFRVRVAGADLTDLVEQGLEEVVVTLEVGDVALHATLELRVDRRRTWTFRSREPVPAASGGSTGGGAGGGGGSGTVPPGPVTFRRLGGEFYNGSNTGGVSVARNQAVFTNMWIGHTAAPLPAVEFSREMVVFVELGIRGTGGYVLTVTGVRSSTSGLTVDSTETRPGSGCGVTSAVSNVWQAIAVPATSGQVTGNQTVTIRTCP